MAERTGKVTENPWRWLRQDPVLAQAMQTILVTGQGGEIITAMRAMTPAAVMDIVGAAFGDLCEEASSAYRAARRRAEVWSFWQLILGIATVCVIVVTMVVTLLGLPMAAAGASAVSLVTGSATLWLDRKVEENRKEAEERFQDMVRYCTQNKLVMQLTAALDGLELEQQERLASAVLGLRL